MEKTQIIKKNKNSFAISISFLVFVVLLTSSLFFYNNKLTNEHESLKKEIQTKVESLQLDSESEAIKIYSLIEINKKYLEKFRENSKITKFLSHMDYIEQTYNLDFRWFSLNNSIIWTSATLNSDEYTEIDFKLAYQKFVSFVSEYRKDENALFELAFINRISWQDEMKFNLNFLIK